MENFKKSRLWRAGVSFLLAFAMIFATVPVFGAVDWVESIESTRSTIPFRDRALTAAEREAWVNEYWALGGASEFELEVIRLANVERANEGLPPVVIDYMLMHATRYYAQIMSVHGMGHDYGAYGGSFETFSAFGGTFTSWAGNAFAFHLNPQNLIDGWMASALHRANILGAGSTRIGVGSFRTPTGGIYHYMMLAGGTNQIPNPVIPTPVPSDITASFTCPNFLVEVRRVTNIAASAPIMVSNVESITELNVQNRNITSLAGIEHFANLQYLNAANNLITAVDVSSNTALTILMLSNTFTSDDLANNNITGNNITSIDVSNNTALVFLGLDNHLIGDNLRMNDFTGNSLTSLNVSSNTALANLQLGNNQLTELDISNNPDLAILRLVGNQLTSIDVSNHHELHYLNLAWNYLTTLDVSQNSLLNNFQVHGNYFDSPDDIYGWELHFDTVGSDVGSPFQFHPQRDPAATPTAPVITNTTTTLTVQQGQAGQLPLAFTGTAPVSFTLGGAPAGVSISNNQLVVANTVAAGTFNFTITASNAAGNSAPRNFTVTVTATPAAPTAPTITSAASASMRYDLGGTFQVVASGTAPISFTLDNQPDGVTINSTTGLITVAPNTLEIDVYTLYITAYNAVDNYLQIFTLTITDAPVAHNIEIIGGGANASATPNPATVGTRINLHAGQAPAGQTFNNWTVSPAAIALTNATSPTAANFEMIDAPVEVTANWRNITTTTPSTPSARPPASGGGGWFGNIIIRPGGTQPVQPPVQPPVQQGVTPPPVIVTTIVYPANVTHVHTVVQNQITAGATSAILTLPTGAQTVSVQAATLQAIVSLSLNLTVITDTATVSIPAAALPAIIQRGGEFDISVNAIASDIGVAVSVSVVSGDVQISNFTAPIGISVPLNNDDIAGINTNRLIAILECGTIIGGAFSDAGVFVLNTQDTTDFTIVYVEHLNRLVIQIGNNTITDLAGNAPTQVMDVLPVIYNGRTLLPVRFMAYALSAEIDWTPETETSPLVVKLTSDGETLSFGIGEISSELADLGMDVPAQIMSDRTMVPLRFISEFFGAVVTWDENTRTVVIVRG
ncbi:MAG: stalk domain-containing protein [Defluviitaleaceae bacterium]|nr:stalk domain-containing protein [Defluviitaleaceae bacterium]